MTFTFLGPPLGCSLDPTNGVLQAGTNIGTVSVCAILPQPNICAETVFHFDLIDAGCQSCQTLACVDARNNSVDLRFNLGGSWQGETAGFLQIKSDLPNATLATPSSVAYPFRRSDVLVITNATGEMRQVRSRDCFINIVTNTPRSFTIDFYPASSVVSKINGIYQWRGSPFRSLLIEDEGNTNRLKVTDALVGTVSLYVWEDGAWTLSDGNGLRRERKTSAFDGDSRIETRVTSGPDGVARRISTEKWRQFPFGARLVEETSGEGAGAVTNRFTFAEDGMLAQEERADGSWAIYQRDPLRRVVRVFEPFLNQPPTTNIALCRCTTYDYTTNFTAASGDNGTNDVYTPRCVIESVLGIEVARRYAVISNNVQLDILAQVPGNSWNHPGNFATRTAFFNDVVHLGEPQKVFRPDGTMTLTSSSQEQVAGLGGQQLDKTTIREGASNADQTDITRGTREERWQDGLGILLRIQRTDIQSGILLEQETYTYDSLRRLTSVLFLDGTIERRTNNCCNLESRVMRNGEVTKYQFDALRREVSQTAWGVTISNVLDSAGAVLAQYRTGTNGSVIRLSSDAFDLAGRQVSHTDARTNTTRFTNYWDATLGYVSMTTFADDSRRSDITARDGLPLVTFGDAVHGTRLHRGVEDDGTGRLARFSQEIKLHPDGSDSSEWVKTYQDALGRPYKTTFPDGAAATTDFVPAGVQGAGKTARTVDPDGVTELLTYDALGEPEFRALDINRNGVIDLAGPDRVMRTVRSVVTNAALGSVVRRVETYEWTDENSLVPKLASIIDLSIDGLRSSRVLWGVTNRSETTNLGRGVTESTAIGPDGVRVVQRSEGGLLLFRERSDSQAHRLARLDLKYDAHRRLLHSTDAATGTRTFLRNDADLIESEISPASDLAEVPPSKINVYDEMNRLHASRDAAGGWFTNEYHATGELYRQQGARTYPVENGIDYAGRPGSLTTWQDFASDGGRAVTRWNRDAQRGFLVSKLFTNGRGPSYTNSAAGRLLLRNWVRGINTTYTQNGAGDVESIDYSDSTPDMRSFEDRRGRVTRVEQSSGPDLAVWEYRFDDAGRLLSETGSYPAIGYRTEARHGYDLLGRRIGYTNLTLGLVVSFSYDSASRLEAVVSGGLTITYRYATNSSSVASTTFQKNGVTRLVTTKLYDLAGRLRAIANAPSAAPSIDFTLKHNQLNQVTNRLNPDGSTWNYSYDILGPLTNAVHLLSDGATRVAGETFAFAFDDIGNRKWAASGGNPTGGGLRAVPYLANRLNQYSWRTNVSIVESSGSADSLAVVTVNGVPALRLGARFWAETPVDNLGGPVSLTITNQSVLGPNSGALLRRTLVRPKMEEFSFDLDGNETGDGLWNRTYDAENRLTSVESKPGVPAIHRRRIEHRYDYRSRRIYSRVFVWDLTALNWRLLTERRFWYDGWNMVGSTDLQRSSEPQNYLWGLDLSGSEQGAGGVGGLLAVIYPPPPAGEADIPDAFVCFDSNGNVTGLVSADDGTVVGTLEYGPFGEPLLVDGMAAEKCAVRFSTKWQEQETSEYYYGSRFYSPGAGQWLSRDPIQEQGGENLYAFVGNNPISLVDPLGQEEFPSITVKRKKILWLALLKQTLGKNPAPDDPYGHWWIEFDGESYGWWPKDGLGLIQTLTGVPGQLNGTEAGYAAGIATATRDTHHGDSADEEFHPRRRTGFFSGAKLKYGPAAGQDCKCVTEAQVKDCLRAFAKHYSGNWSYPWGQNCHSFQSAGMNDCCVKK